MLKKVGYLISYIFFLLFVGLFTILPFRVAYLFSDFVYFILFYLTGYRKKISYENLKKSFPEKTEKEIQKILKQFYHHLGDLLVEGIKGFSMTRKQIVKRHKMVNPEILQSFLDKGQSVICTTAHYNNWEWGTMSGTLQVNGKAMGLYMPLSNPYIDKFMKKTRSGKGTELISIFRTLHGFRDRKDQVYGYMLAADQNPPNARFAYWMTFLNQETACINGPEKYARMFDYPVLFLTINKVKRGYYEIVMEQITDNPNSLDKGEITVRYMRLLEKNIRKTPQYWLWSHRRWKKSRPENKELIG